MGAGAAAGMSIDFLLERFEAHAQDEAIVWRDRSYDYAWLSGRVEHWRARIRDEDVAAGSVAILEADFSPDAVALFIALCERGCVLVPLTSTVEARKPEFIRIAEGEVCFRFDDADGVAVTRTGVTATHPHYQELRRRGTPGLVLFSSGSTGEAKAAVHDLAALLEKFRVPRKQMRTISFLLYDHIGGVNTMLYTLSNGGCLVTVTERSPDAVLAAVERHRVELLPTSPTFINLVLLSEAHQRYELQTLHTVTYGTEPMPQSTLEAFHARFPNIRLQQTYGLSEVGILRSKSRASDSLWVRLGGEGFETRVVDGVFQIKARSAMLGYLNAPSPFTEDGWFDTGDLVEVDGEWIRFLGRRSEVINVGGEKVHPAEVESVLQGFDGVAEARVYAEPNPIVGNIVCADVRPADGEVDPRSFVTSVKRACAEQLERYKVPVKINVVFEPMHGGRFKKSRRAT